MKHMVLIAACLTWVPSAGAQATLWICSNPDNPFHYVDSESKKSEPPPCRDWTEIRGKNLEGVLEALASERFTTANRFLAKASEESGLVYPGVETGSPVTTTKLYDNPERYGFRISSLEEATPGALVVYRGLGGILVETRSSPSEPWKPQVLYPSAAAGYQLRVTDINIRGERQARILERATALDRS
jgi:hypothetical protein